MGSDDASFTGIPVVAGTAGEDLAFGNKRTGTLYGRQFAIILNPRAPGGLAAAGVEGVNKIIGAQDR